MNGKEAKQHAIPWQVALVDRIDAKEASCGGMIINSHVVLSAAHCFDLDDIEYKGVKSFPWYVLTGKHDFNEPGTGTPHKICKVLIHEKWNRRYTGSMDYDFALVYLKQKIHLNVAQRPVCLDLKKTILPENFSDGDKLRVSGWGITDPNDQRSASAKLMEVDV